MSSNVRSRPHVPSSTIQNPPQHPYRPLSSSPASSSASSLTPAQNTNPISGALSTYSTTSGVAGEVGSFRSGLGFGGAGGAGAAMAAAAGVCAAPKPSSALANSSNSSAVREKQQLQKLQKEQSQQHQRSLLFGGKSNNTSSNNNSSVDQLRVRPPTFGSTPTSAFPATSLPPPSHHNAHASTLERREAENSGMVDVLTAKVGQMKDLAVMLGDEVRGQNKMLDEMGEGFENVQNKVKRLMKDLGQMVENTGWMSGSTAQILFLIIFAFIVFILLYMLFKH